MDFLVWCSSQDVFEEEKVPHEAALMERLEKVQESVGTKSRVDMLSRVQRHCTPVEDSGFCRAGCGTDTRFQTGKKKATMPSKNLETEAALLLY